VTVDLQRCLGVVDRPVPHQEPGGAQQFRHGLNLLRIDASATSFRRGGTSARCDNAAEKIDCSA
jgi:hypothetical protein